jgi:hypothetical protein
MIIKIIDNLFSHEPNFITDSSNIHYIRNTTPTNTIIINKDDNVMYTDTSLTKKHPLAKLNIALMIESQELHSPYYTYIEKNNHLFDTVLTFDKKLLDKGENYRLNLYGTTWLHESYRNIWSKTTNKLCSLILSNKKITSGHKLRHVVAGFIKKFNINTIDIYGGSFIQLPFTTTKAYQVDHSPTHISNKKIVALKDYMFSIVIENCKEDYYFTEKLIDCFLTGTVPIYYGCPSIAKFFNEKGILSFSNPKECFDIIKTLTKEKYDEMEPFIKENFEKAQGYTKFKINEKHVVEFI